ncbi:MAG: MerR family transcriptional regulator [Actinomycetota bacterium]|nr:MerR family transcriptional regulator [Actinomycetota bacterium]
MTPSAASARAFLTIGEVLSLLRGEFPDVTISKIRFLEAEGLIEPDRTASGYRKFSRDDVSRLRYVLAAQRDQYLPLRVIKEHLDAIDRGLEPPSVSGGSPRVPRALVSTDGLPTAAEFGPGAGGVRLSRQELISESGLDEDALRAVEQYGLIARPGNGFYDGDELLIAKTVAEMSRFGIEARHLRAYRSAADREIGLFEQVVSPMTRQRNPEARGRAQETVRELAALSIRLHSTLVRAGLRSELSS